MAVRSRRAAARSVVVVLLAVAATACTSQGEQEPPETGANEVDGAVDTGRPDRADDDVDGLHPDEWAERYAACIREQGFAAEASPDGGVAYEPIAEAQAADLEAAADACDEQVQVASRYTEELDESQLRFLYQWYVTESVPCLEAEGLGGFDPPSEHVFVATYREQPWTPHLEVDGRLGPGAITQEIEARCPSVPDRDELADARDAGG